MSKKLTVTSLYSGCGGLDYGFNRLGFETIFANDIDRDSCKSFENLIKKKATCGDIKDFLNILPKSDVLIGGPPCQSFSLLGKRKKDDPRGKEIFNFIKTIKFIKPSVILFENVPGIKNSYIGKKKLTEYIVNYITKLGFNAIIKEFDCTNYLIPQTRKRQILIAWKKNLSEPITPSINKIVSYLKLNLDTEISDLGLEIEIDKTNIFSALDDLPVPVLKGNKAKYKYKPKTFYQKYLRDGNNSNNITCHFELRMSPLDKEYIKYIKPGGNYKQIPDSVASPRVMRIKKTGGRTTTYGRLDPKKFSATINTYFNRPNVGTNYHYSQKRLITPREALRIQSFPDYFTPEFSSIRSLCRQIGNAVPPLLSIFLAHSVKSIFRK